MELWDGISGAELRRLTGHEQYIFQAVFSDDGARILSGGGDGTARLWIRKHRRRTFAC